MIELRWKIVPPHTKNSIDVDIGCGENGLYQRSFAVLQYRESVIAYDEEGRADHGITTPWTDVEISDE